MPAHYGARRAFSLGAAAIGLAVGLPSFASMIAIGDSITAGQVATTNAERWANIVAASRGAGLTNAGIPGTVLQNSNGASGAPLTDNGRDRYAAAMTAANKKDFAFVAYGFNDARYTAALDTFNVANYRGDLREVIQGLLAGGYTPVTICIVSPYWITATGLTTGTSGFAGQTRVGFEHFVAAAEAVASEFGTFYADAYAYMRDNGGDSLISVDNIHPTSAGHAVIAACIQAAVKKTAKPDTTAPIIFTLASQSRTENTARTLRLLANEPVTWSIVPGGNGSLFSISDQDLTLPATVGTTSYTITVRATDLAGNTTDRTLTFTATGANAAFVTDSFTDTDGTAITAHTGEAGATWSLQTGYAPSTPNVITAGRMWSPTALGVYQVSGVPASADYEVSAILDCITAVGNDNVAVCARMQAGANTFYWARYLQGTGWQLYKTVAGTSTQLGSTFSDTFAAGTSRKVTLRVVGSALTVLVDDVVRISATDAAITDGGKSGVRFGFAKSATTGIHMDRLETKPAA